MKKTAKTNYDIHPILKKRWSPRAFLDKEIQPEIIKRVLEAARWSPSASNEQPWSYIVGFRADMTYSRIYDSLVEFNQLWAKFAPVLFLSLANKHNHKFRDNDYYLYDVGQSVAHLTFQAMHEGLYVHQMGGFDDVIIKQGFNIPEYFIPVTVVAIGYIGDPEILHPNLKKLEEAERERKRVADFVFGDDFGKPLMI
ncbi:MAG: nitroreductase family protein [Bacteroidales bacterium]|nr:nitroreductase family protein [Bacteroidales bacterium]